MKRLIALLTALTTLLCACAAGEDARPAADGDSVMDGAGQRPRCSSTAPMTAPCSEQESKAYCKLVAQIIAA